VTLCEVPGTALHFTPRYEIAKHNPPQHNAKYYKLCTINSLITYIYSLIIIVWLYDEGKKLYHKEIPKYEDVEVVPYN